MAQMPAPTKQQIRQHALDRALVDPVVVALSKKPAVASGLPVARTGEELATEILIVADRFATWLSEGQD